MHRATYVVLARAPRAGHSMMSLCPPCTPQQAARLAEASLRDTIDVVVATPAHRRVLALDGLPPAWLPEELEILPQRGEALDERLAAAFEDVGTPAVLIGPETPQLTTTLLREAWRELTGPGADAVLAHVFDGGYWAIGLRVHERALFAGLPLCTDESGARQEQRLREHGRRVALLRPLRGIHRIEDARAVASAAPDGRFARALAAIAG